MELRLPAPCVVVLIGPSASGKTTWALEHFAANEVVSSDALRAMLGTDEGDQRASTAAFEVLHRIVAERVSRKLTTVVDTMGFNAEDRRRWVELAHQAGLPVYAIVFDTPAEECEQRNADRPRSIPKSVLRKQLTRFRVVAEEVGGEGFDGVHTQQPAAVVPPQFLPTPATKAEESRSQSHSFGLLLNRFDWPDGDLGNQVAAVARRAEEAGFRDLWVMDHLRQIPRVGRAWENLPEAYTMLSYLAAVTERVRLGVLVTPVTNRNPVLLGKMVATLDVLSGGRAVCGLGAGWDAEEHAAYGIEFPPLAERYALIEDTLRMLPLLWGPGAPSFEGRTFNAAELICYPRPIQEQIPILVGGSGGRTTLRLVARYADACNLFGDPDRVRGKVEVLRGHCEEVGRDPAEIEVTHLVTVVVAADRASLRRRVEELRGRDTTQEAYATRHNAGTVEDHIGLFFAYAQAGARHSIVSLPDVAMEGSIEAFGEIIAKLKGP